MRQSSPFYHAGVYPFLLLIATFLSGCIISAEPEGFEEIRGSGILETQTADVSDFTGVSMAIPGELSITQGDTETLTISAQPNLLPYIDIFVDNGLLRIETEDDINIQPTRTIQIELAVRSLDEIIFAGDGLVTVDTLVSTNLEVNLAGSGDIEINQLTSVLLETSLAGSGDLFYSGIVEGQDIVLAGSGDIEARTLESKNVNIEIAGSGSAVLNVSDELTALIVGSGSVRYLGSPTVESTIVGSGTVGPL